MELIEAIEKGNLFIVKVRVKFSWLERMLGSKNKIDEVVINKNTSKVSTSYLACKGSLDIALHEYYKYCGIQ